MENLRFFFSRIFGGEAPDQGHGGVSLNEVKVPSVYPCLF